MTTLLSNSPVQHFFCLAFDYLVYPVVLDIASHPAMFTYLVFALFLIRASADAAIHKSLEFSLDGGSTWLQKLPPNTVALPTFVKLRLRDGKSFISLPACAAERGPASIEWRGLGALGVRDTELCATNDEEGFQHLYTDPIQLVPAWHKYMHDSGNSRRKRSTDDVNDNGDEFDESAQGESGKKRRGFWSKYGFYIVAFICFSLIQGIREGNAQYHQEMEEAARAEAAAKRSETGTKTSITVPRRKSKSKKNAAKKS